MHRLSGRTGFKKHRATACACQTGAKRSRGNERTRHVGPICTGRSVHQLGKNKQKRDSSSYFIMSMHRGEWVTMCTLEEMLW